MAISIISAITHPVLYIHTHLVTHYCKVPHCKDLIFILKRCKDLLTLLFCSYSQRTSPQWKTKLTNEAFREAHYIKQWICPRRMTHLQLRFPLLAIGYCVKRICDLQLEFEPTSPANQIKTAKGDKCRCTKRIKCAVRSASRVSVVAVLPRAELWLMGDYVAHGFDVRAAARAIFCCMWAGGTECTVLNQDKTSETTSCIRNISLC